jgi:FlaA1/EpsC-like NDP-sugar epimerase
MFWVGGRQRVAINDFAIVRHFAPVARWLLERPQASKMLIMALTDAVVLVFMILLAYALRVSSFNLPPQDKLPLYFVGPAMSILFAGFAGVYRSATRGYSASLERNLIISQLPVPFVWTLILLAIGTNQFARSTVLIYFMLAILSMLALRRVAFTLFSSGLGPMPANAKAAPVVIYGAGREGQIIAESLRRSGRYKPIAFVDTDYTLLDRTVAGLRVFPIERMNHITKRWQPDEVIIAKPGQNRTSRRQLVDMFINKGLKVKIVPGHQEILDGHVNVDELRDISLEDLLGRDPVPPDKTLMAGAIHKKVVMVTGAGGSIGSEIVRQVFTNHPLKIILVDNSEFSLFQIHRELENHQHDENTPLLVAALADATDGKAMMKLMKDHHVQVVFHAAAYKHVRMVQENAAAGVENNVWGTLAVADAAMQTGVERFVLISTDKAVRPTSVMGASKRVAELVIQSFANEKTAGHKPIFSIVRFGNVLGSTGSVVPIFKEQIAAGGPVLVTDPEVTRYFMLIPEAAQLVIQAGAMAEGGEVFVLDMGEPIKIKQLAETMIELAGYRAKTDENPGGDIEIRYIGLRDGEKMFEELQIGRDATSTSHPRVLRSNEIWIRQKELNMSLASIKSAIVKQSSDVAGKLVLELAHRER